MSFKTTSPDNILGSRAEILEHPIWLDDLKLFPDLQINPLNSVDVAIIGSGYTGLNAALELARGGRSTLILDASDLGWGCSTRNGGHISTSIKPTLTKLTARYGEKSARAIRNEGESALNWIEALVARENIDCDFQRSGRFHAAHTPRHFQQLVRESEQLAKDEGVESYAVSRQHQQSEIGSDAYFGGVVFPRHASLHPAKFHQGLLKRAVEAGVHITGNCKVQHVERSSGDYILTTAKGQIKARDVIIATNGYTSGLAPWLDRRIIPIGSYVIATEPLPTTLIDKLFPKGRTVSDTCKVVYYYRATTDRKRVVFGGRVSASETDPRVSGPLLFTEMCRIFPELAAYKVSHSWCGTVAYTFDELPHIGTNDGMHYALGYCGSGVSMASYLGMRLGHKVLGNSEGNTAFDGLHHPTRPFYKGNPWFLPAVVAWYRWRDQMQCRNAQDLR